MQKQDRGQGVIRRFHTTKTRQLVQVRRTNERLIKDDCRYWRCGVLPHPSAGSIRQGSNQGGCYVYPFPLTISFKAMGSDDHSNLFF